MLNLIKKFAADWKIWDQALEKERAHEGHSLWKKISRVIDLYEWVHQKYQLSSRLI